jgi:hypothetical protein
MVTVVTGVTGVTGVIVVTVATVVTVSCCDSGDSGHGVKKRFKKRFQQVLNGSKFTDHYGYVQRDVGKHFTSVL